MFRAWIFSILTCGWPRNGPIQSFKSSTAMKRMVGGGVAAGAPVAAETGRRSERERGRKRKKRSGCIRVRLMVGLLGEPAGFAEAFAGAAGERTAEIGAAFFGERRETLNDLVVAAATSVFSPGLRASSKSAGAGRETVS